MDPLDLATPYDDLIDLRGVLSAQQIAELTGLRRETISRARPDRPFRRQTVRVVTDLNVVVGRLREVIGGEPGQLAALLERPQRAFNGDSIAALVRAGRVEAVLEHLEGPENREDSQLENIQFDSEVTAELRDLESVEGATGTDADADEHRVAALIADDPDLSRQLPTVERKIREFFGTEVKVERTFVSDRSDLSGAGHLHLAIRSGSSVEEQIGRLEALLADMGDPLVPPRTPLTIGTL